MLTKKIIAGAGLIGLTSLISRLLGVYRDHLFAVIFGTSGYGIYDIAVYHTAFRVPDFLYSVLIYGAVSSAFIPIFTSYIVEKKEKEAWHFCNNVLNILIITITFVAISMFIFAPFILKFFALGFTGQRYALMIDLTRIMLLTPIFFGVSSIFQAISNTFKKFFYYSIAPIIYNLSIVIGTLFFSKTYGVYALTYSVVIGSFLHALVQFPQILNFGFKYRFNIDLRSHDIKKFFRLILPRIFGLTVDQLSLVLNATIATTLSYRASTILPYAINIQSLPLGLFGIAFAIASFSTFAELASKKMYSELAMTLKNSISHVLFFVIPACFGLYLIRFELIDFIFGGGAFVRDDVVLTAKTLSYLLIGLPFQAVIPILARVFYSFANTKTPVFIGIFSIVINLILILLFTKFFDFDAPGIALAMSVAMIFNALMLMFFIKSHLKLYNFLAFFNILKITISSASMYLILKYFYLNLFSLFASALIPKFIIFGVVSLAGVSIYGVTAWILSVSEIKILLKKYHI